MNGAESRVQCSRSGKLQACACEAPQDAPPSAWLKDAGLGIPMDYYCKIPNDG